MTMPFWLVLVIVAVIIAVLVLRKKPRPKQVTSQRLKSDSPVNKAVMANSTLTAKAETKSDFSGSRIEPGDRISACDAVRALENKTYQLGKEPSLPLPGCDAASCSCQVVPFTERRKGSRRVTPDRRGDIRLSDDRRSGKDRRKGADTWKNTV
jgi:hypothetical protein